MSTGAKSSIQSSPSKVPFGLCGARASRCCNTVLNEIHLGLSTLAVGCVWGGAVRERTSKFQSKISLHADSLLASANSGSLPTSEHTQAICLNLVPWGES